MGRPSSIRGTALQPRIDALLDEGHVPKEIARIIEADKVGTSESSIFRYARSRKSNLSKAFDGETGPVDLLIRLVEVADGARATRLAAIQGGSAATATRAATVEAQVLGKLLSEYDVTSTAVRDVFGEVKGLTTVLRKIVATRPETAQILAAELAEEPTTRDLSTALYAALTPSGDRS